MNDSEVNRQPVRWGVLGLARIAMAKTIPGFATASGATLAAVASRDADKARKFAREHGIPRGYGPYQALLDDPEIEAVYIPLPNDLHFEWCVRAMEAGKHVLCEKPLCLSPRDVAALIETRARTGRHIEEAFVFRNHPQWRALERLLADGSIGEARAVQGTLARQFFDPNDIRNNPAMGGGALYDLGSYIISACSVVFGRAPLRVVAAIDRDPSFGIDRLTTALLDYGGRHATFTVGTQSGPPEATHQQFSVLGSNGWLRFDFPYAHARSRDCHIFVGDSSSMGSFETSTHSFEPADQYALQIERFSRMLRGAPVPSWPIEDALSTLRTIEALFASARDGGWVTL
jgi:predicted dehydrogenase